MVNTYQTDYALNIKAPPPGVVEVNGDGRTGIAEGAIGFGLAVSRGDVATNGDKAIKQGGSVAAFRGISIRDITLANVATPDAYKQGDNVGYLTEGSVWVSPVEAVTAGNPVFFDATTGRLGDTNTGSKLGPIIGAEWETSDAADGRAKVRLAGVYQQGAVDPTPD